MPEKKRLFVSCFAGGGEVPVETMISMLTLAGDLNGRGITVDWDLRPAGPYVMKERNISVMKFLESEATHMLFVDADLAFEPDIAWKMLEKNVDLVGAMYRYKMDEEAYPIQLLTNEETGEYYEKDGLFKAAGIPTGFMLISRNCIETLIEEYPETRFEVKESKTGKTSMILYDLFDCVLYGGQWWGEDYVFCRRWTALGGDCWAYADGKIAHIGKKGWIGSFRDYYKNNFDSIVTANNEALKQIKEAETTQNGN